MNDLVEIAGSKAPMAEVLAEVAARRRALLGVLPELDAMNSYVRSDAHRRGSVSSSLAKVVYHYKREALRELTQLQLATHRAVSVITQCRDCGGSGCYTDYNGYTHDHCWACSSSGDVKLRFVESMIYGSYVWHTPIRDAYTFLSRAHELPEHPVDDWTVHQKGNDLTPSRVAAAMNAIEDVITRRPTWRGNWGQARTLHDSYTLWVGETSRDVCLICGSTKAAPHYGHIVRTGRLHWSGAACRVCVDASKGGEIFDVLAGLMPQAFLTPEVRAWVERHPSPPEPARSEPSGPLIGRQTFDDESIPF